VRSDQGTNVTIELKHNFLDPVPRVRVGGETVELARALAWYEYLWIGIPILHVFAGGAIGAVVGLSAAYASARVFRADLNAIARYSFTGLISVAALVAFAVLATLAQLAIHG
jgi:hypothetical protein